MGVNKLIMKFPPLKNLNATFLSLLIVVSLVVIIGCIEMEQGKKNDQNPNNDYNSKNTSSSNNSDFFLSIETQDSYSWGNK